jgi:ATP-dependent protease HslVU (ClpYQ) ATPase subunit
MMKRVTGVMDSAFLRVEAAAYTHVGLGELGRDVQVPIRKWSSA